MKEILTTVFHINPSQHPLGFPDVIAFEGDESENMNEILSQVSAKRQGLA